MLTQLFCRGRDQQERVFFVDVPERLDAWPLSIRVHRSNPIDPKDDCFSLTLDRFRDGLIVTEINHNSKEWYSQKGIGDALLPEVARLTGMRIYSGSNTAKQYRKEFRSVGAGNLWLRLLQDEIATYLPEEDRFTLPRNLELQSEHNSSAFSAAVIGAARPARQLPVFPDIQPVSMTQSRFLPLQDDDIRTPEDLKEFLFELYDDPECTTYIYFANNKPMNRLLATAEGDGQINLKEIAYYYYKLPIGRSRRNYVQITPDQLDRPVAEDCERDYLMREKAIVAVGPMYGQITVRLTPRMERYFEMHQAAQVQRDSDLNPIELKPNFFGLGIDLNKLWRRLTRKREDSDDKNI